MTDKLSEALRRAQEAQDLVLAAQEALRLAHEARDAAAVALVGADGFTYREAGLLLGISHGRVGQLVTAAKRKGWGTLPDGFRVTAADRLAQAREAFYLARVAQEQRAERSSLGYREEERAFYGDERVAAVDDAEQRIKWKGFYERNTA